MDLTTAPMHHAAMLWAVVVGGIAAVMAIGLSQAIHFSEGLFERLPVHWMWWPAIGGLLVGAGGLVFPQALGTGYDVVRDLVRHDITWQLLIGILLVKTLVWVIALGSNTAGGILAPLLMIGGAMGAVLGHWLPMISPGAWAIVGMTSLLGAAIGAPLTSTMLAVELTHNGGLMLPVLLACITAYGISILMEPRSMLTEGLSRRGLHLSREYGVDPLELVRVGQAMHTSVFALPAGATRRDAALWLRSMEERGATAWSHWQRLFPLVDAEGRLTAALTRSQMIQAAGAGEPDRELWRDGTTEPRRMSPGETLRQAAAEMARADLTSYPVVEADGRLAGILTIKDLLTARTREASRDSDRARVLSLRWPFRGGGGSAGSQMARTAERLDGEDVV